jgi:hypothetical protein
MPNPSADSGAVLVRPFLAVHWAYRLPSRFWMIFAPSGIGSFRFRFKTLAMKHLVGLWSELVFSGRICRRPVPPVLFLARALFASPQQTNPSLIDTPAEPRRLNNQGVLDSRRQSIARSLLSPSGHTGQAAPALGLAVCRRVY